MAFASRFGRGSLFQPCRLFMSAAAACTNKSIGKGSTFYGGKG